MHPVLRTLLAGVYDEECILNCLLGKPHLIELIWRFYIDFFRKHIHLPEPINIYDGDVYETYATEALKTEKREFDVPNITFYKRLYQVTFPEPKDLNINMMPFKFARNFKDSCLPKTLQPYWELISEISYGYRKSYSEGVGEIWYLTIHEGWVEADESQRRPGLHTDNPGPLEIPSDQILYERNLGSGAGCKYFYEHSWGNGMILSTDIVVGGIYMASTVAESCQVWNCKVDPDVVGELGDLEHIRGLLSRKEVETKKLEENTLYWITDKTPHESLPLKERTYRQFVRVVTKDVSLWFEDHSTPNPNGIKPNPKITKIVKGNKFDPSSLVVVESKKSTSKLKKFMTKLKV